MEYRCERCGCYLDPGERCECEDCIDQPRRQTVKRKTIYPREWVPENYTKTKYQYSDKR